MDGFVIPSAPLKPKTKTTCPQDAGADTRP